MTREQGYVLSTTQRVVCPQVADRADGLAAIRWVERLPGMMRAYTQRESTELVLTYDLRHLTLATIRRHLQRGGISCEASLIQRWHMLAVHRAERTVRALHGLSGTPATEDIPFVPTTHAA